jgi:sulfur transfer complex TusBCD TusB component (DsrH family)
MPFTRQSRLVVSDEQVSTALGDEAVILGLQDGVYYGLDTVGARVWTLLATPRRVAEIVDTVAEEFDVPLDRCERDVLALLDDLSARRLIREHPDEGDAAVP